MQYFQDVMTCRQEDLVICWDDGSPIFQRIFNNWFDKTMKRMGIDKMARNLSPHSFRHSIVTHLKQAREVIQAMIGYVDEKTTDGYTHYQDQYLVEEIRKLEKS
jgi:site-specific recombinase XerD